MKTAILFVTHIYNGEVKRQIDKLHQEAGESATLYVVYQADRIRMTPPEGVRQFPFTIRELNLLGYKSWGCTLMDGNFHFVVLDFYLHHPSYDNYWLVEYDVRFNGHWDDFFSFFKDKNEDFISAHIETVNDNPDWMRWHEFETVNLQIGRSALLKSFNPICRFSNRALALLHERCRLGDRGHNELLMPTLFNHFQLSISDFGGKGKYSYKEKPNLFYMEDTNSDGQNKWTHRVWPTYTEESMSIPNMIYHPIK